MIISIFAMAITMFIYWIIDTNFHITKKINSLTKIKQEWKSTIFVILMFILIIILNLMTLSNLLHSLLLGVIIGISISIISNLNKLIKK